MKKMFLAIALAFAACTPSHDRMKATATAALKKVNDGFMNNKIDSAAIAASRVATYDFVKAFPADTLSPALLFELALIYEKQRQMDSSLKVLDRIYTGYPQSRQAPKSLFLEGYLYANELQQLIKAREKYELFLKQYAAVDAKMTGDVQLELQNLGKTPEQLLQEILEKRKADSLQAKP